MRELVEVHEGGHKHEDVAGECPLVRSRLVPSRIRGIHHQTGKNSCNLILMSSAPGKTRGCLVACFMRNFQIRRNPRWK